MIDTARHPARIESSSDGTMLHLGGAWVTAALADLELQLATVKPGPGTLDAAGRDALDTGGADALRRLLGLLRSGGDTFPHSVGDYRTSPQLSHPIRHPTSGIWHLASGI